jgi:hypothetical protein
LLDTLRGHARRLRTWRWEVPLVKFSGLGGLTRRTTKQVGAGSLMIGALGGWCAGSVLCSCPMVCVCELCSVLGSCLLVVICCWCFLCCVLGLVCWLSGPGVVCWLVLVVFMFLCKSLATSFRYMWGTADVLNRGR